VPGGGEGGGGKGHKRVEEVLGAVAHDEEGHAVLWHPIAVEARRVGHGLPAGLGGGGRELGERAAEEARPAVTWEEAVEVVVEEEAGAEGLEAAG
jgi:hypothetical protein